jgi:hypothetical protein
LVQAEQMEKMPKSKPLYALAIKSKLATDTITEPILEKNSTPEITLILLGICLFIWLQIKQSSKFLGLDNRIEVYNIGK